MRQSENIRPPSQPSLLSHSRWIHKSASAPTLGFAASPSSGTTRQFLSSQRENDTSLTRDAMPSPVRRTSGMSCSLSERSLPVSISSRQSSRGNQRSFTPKTAAKRRAKEKFDRRLAEDFHSTCSLPSVRGRPSTAALKENWVKQRYTMEAEERKSTKNAEGKSDPDQGKADDAHDSKNLAERAQAFNEDIGALGHRIADLGKGLRMETVGTLMKEARERKEREEARRAREEELRLARQKENDARDPKKKIALRLENKRLFEGDSESLDAARIPTMQLVVPGGQGVQHVEVVDTLKLSSSCQLLSNTRTASVKALLEYQRSRDVAQRYVSEHGTPMFSKTRSPRLELLSDDEVQPPRLLAKPWEERRGNVVQQKKERYAEVMLHKYQKCHRKASGSPSSPLLQHALQKLEAMKTIEMANSGLDAVKAKDLRRLTRRQTREMMKEQQRLKARVKKLWRLLRGVTMVFIVFLKHRRRRNAVIVVKDFVSHLGEWARVRAATKRLNQKIRLLQCAFRTSASLKRQRCELLSKQWQRVEDKTLQQYFKMYSTKIMTEMQATAEGVEISPRTGTRRFNASITPGDRKKAAEFIRLMMHSAKISGSNQNDFANAAIDWKSYRIPSSDRMSVIGQYYMMNLRNHVLRRQRLFKALEMSYQNHKEMVGFLQQLGADTTQGTVAFDAAAPTQEPVKEVAMQREFWHMTEEKTLELIAIAAQALADVPPMHDHPANKDIPESSNYRKALRRHKSDRRVDIGGDRRGDGMSKAVSLGRLVASKQHEEEDEKKQTGPPSLDDVFQSFSPRLRKITEEQAAEYRSSISDKH